MTLCDIVLRKTIVNFSTLTHTHLNAMLKTLFRPHQLNGTWHFCDTNMKEHMPTRNRKHHTFTNVTLLWHCLVVDKILHQNLDTHQPTCPCSVGNLSQSHRLEITWHFCDTALWKQLRLNPLLHTWSVNYVTLCDTVLWKAIVNFQHFDTYTPTHTLTSRQCWKPSLALTNLIWRDTFVTPPWKSTCQHAVASTNHSETHCTCGEVALWSLQMALLFPATCATPWCQVRKT